jgi:hypothetical protein
LIENVPIALRQRIAWSQRPRECAQLLLEQFTTPDDIYDIRHCLEFIVEKSLY